MWAAGPAPGSRLQRLPRARGSPDPSSPAWPGSRRSHPLRLRLGASRAQARSGTCPTGPGTEPWGPPSRPGPSGRWLRAEGPGGSPGQVGSQRRLAGCSAQGHLLATELECSPALWVQPGKDTVVLGWGEGANLSDQRSSDAKSGVQSGPPCHGRGPGGAREAPGVTALAVATQTSVDL